MKKILHIAIDEKFIESANWQFEKIYPGSNKFYIIIPDVENYKLEHVKTHTNFEILPNNKQSLKFILDQIDEYDLVVLHNIDYFKSKIVYKSNKKIKFLWLFWGFEIYNEHKYFSKKIYGDLTKKEFFDSKHISIKDVIKQQYDAISNFSVYRKLIKLKAIKKIKYFSTIIKEEYDLLKNLNIISSEYIKFSYYPLEFIFKNHEDIYIAGNNILLGNSATETNNHLEAFEILKNCNLQNKKIIVPLSYGNMEYAKQIIKTGKTTFGTLFEPLTEFMSLNEYNNIIQSCDILIMNAYRQQAEGNIFAMLWMGAKVYLDERNTVYNYLKRIGCLVYSINKDLKPENKNAFSPLNKNEIERNREILKNEIGKESLLNNLKKQIDKILYNNY
ncbi:MAG: TDP-N-acetylfucosamine:lipid II N-acetylfucosaminyltransferase [Actinobacteria bacterium]|nr:TDP-N-acetylfucosamine:lipid II N-acetylfucosaminyltransferase [Actinomycetota bacterium]